MPFVALAAVSGPLAAQDARVQDVRVQDTRDLPPQMPVTFTAPAGLCRIWLDGVPATQQPAPTDCASAIKNRPASAAIVFGPKRRTEGSELESFTRRPGSPLVRQLAPNTLAPRRRDDARDRPADSSARTVRKPEKPQ